ncbi:MAG TPA: hypothetical protein VM536_21355, partial [Chloroflexia bacterium]|nr:hypothetical protein [Chloroflexia bacterium]
LLRMGRPDKALFAVATGLASTLLVLALWLQGRVWLDRLFWTLFITAAGDTGLFLYLQLAEYQAWRRRHPGAEPAGGWGAAIWALIGFTLTLLIWGGAILGLVLLRPSRAA